MKISITINIEKIKFGNSYRYIATSKELPGFLAETFSLDELEEIAPELIVQHFLIENVPAYKTQLIKKAKEVKTKEYRSFLRGLTWSFVLNESFATV